MGEKKRINHPGREKGHLQRTTIEIRDMICRICGDPLEGMARLAAGDVLALGYMTAKELKEPATYGLGGRVVRPSGMERALSYVSPELRMKMFQELAQYIYAKRRTITIENEAGENAIGRGQGVVLYLPHNGREEATMNVKREKP